MTRRMSIIPVALPLVALLCASMVIVVQSFQAQSQPTASTMIGTRRNRPMIQNVQQHSSRYKRSLPLLFATKKKKKKTTTAKKASGGGSKGGGFGMSKSSEIASTSTIQTIAADKNSLEKQWDIFTEITDLEIVPKGNPEDEDYIHFEVADVFVRCGGNNKSEQQENKSGTTGWFRIGKVCCSGGDDDSTSSIEASLTLQKGLIYWTAVHMRRELVAAGGKSGAAQLELGFISPPTMYMGAESDGPLDDEEAEDVQLAQRVSIKDISQSSRFGFRPDWNPPGFTYKRREKAAMKKKTKKSNLEAIEEMS